MPGKPTGPNEQNLQEQCRERRIEKQSIVERKKIEKKQAIDRARSKVRYKKERREHSKHVQELANRELAKRNLIQYIKRFNQSYEAGWVHHDICRRLQNFYRQVLEKKSPRLMLFVPPRHGKSYIASDFWPSWVLGHSPELKFISASYAVSLPLGFSRNVRARVQDPAYKVLFPRTALSKDSKSAETWETTQGGMFIAAGVGGGITGKGADIFVIDDPIKDAEEADSEVVRDKVWDWYGSTAYTRMSPGGGMLIIQTRWHDDDLSGRAIIEMNKHLNEGTPEGEFDHWEIVEYPALATEDEWMIKGGRIVSEKPKEGRAVFLRHKDEALHPDRFPYKSLMRIKSTLQPRHWSALYQQNPIPEEGLYFTKDMFRYVPQHPPLHAMKIFIAGDLAIGEKETNDYTVFVVGGLDYQDQVHILDLVRFRGDTFAIVEALLNLSEKYDPYLVGIEKGQLEHAIKPQLQKRMRERRIFPTLAEGDKALRPITDKPKRARPLQGRMQQGMVHFPHASNAPWVDIAIAEMLRFPGGVHDDIVDALAWLLRMILDEEPPQPPKEARKKSWRDRLSDHYVSGSRRKPMAA